MRRETYPPNFNGIADIRIRLYLGHNFKPLYLKFAESGQKAFRKLYGAWAKKNKERNPNYVTVLSASKKGLGLGLGLFN